MRIASRRHEKYTLAMQEFLAEQDKMSSYYQKQAGKSFGQNLDQVFADMQHLHTQLHWNQKMFGNKFKSTYEPYSKFINDSKVPQELRRQLNKARINRMAKLTNLENVKISGKPHQQAEADYLTAEEEFAKKSGGCLLLTSRGSARSLRAGQSGWRDIADGACAGVGRYVSRILYQGCVDKLTV